MLKLIHIIKEESFMKKYFKKNVLVSLAFIMSLTAFSLNGNTINAKEDVKTVDNANQTITEAEQMPQSYNSLTPEQKAIYDEAIEIEIAKYRGEIGFNEKQFREGVKSFVFTDDAHILKNEMRMNSLARWRYTGIWIDNKIVAAGINTGIALLTGGAGTLGVKMLVRKIGTKAAIKAIEKAIRNKLVWFGLKQFTGITPVIATIVKNALDPGIAFAKWYDSIDKRPRNGRCDIL